jgi:hypothetical protein
MRRTLLLLGVVGACSLTGLTIWWTSPGRAQPGNPILPERPPSRSLPLTQVILFNTGVGYFQREGEVEGDTRVDLNFPSGDVNDLIKSLVLHDSSKLGTIHYDGPESLERALRSFSLDLTWNPTYGQILNQARGEKVEVVTQGGGAANTFTGDIVGMETGNDDAGKEAHFLNLLANDGMRRVSLAQIQRIRFLNPVLEEEFRRALSVLAGTHNNQRRSVRVQLKGEGKRQVKLGYVVESPIWKASYRLMIDHKAKEPTLQSWAVVENTSDEDWKDLRVALVAARPISFQMDLSQPLFLPRPTVETRAYASLRPPVFQGAVPATNPGLQLGGGINLGGLPGGAGQGINLGGMPGGGLQLGGFGGQVGNPGGANTGINLGAIGGGLGMQVSPPVGPNPGMFNRYQVGPSGPLAPETTLPSRPKLTYEDLQQRREEMLQKREQDRERARRVGSSIAELGEGIDALVANSDTLGDSFRYTIDQKVSLPRQMSSLLPLFNKAVQSSPLSIYNKQVHPRFPLKSLRLKNTTGQNIVQGPVSVFENGAYAGDSQILDMQPEQERLFSYAMDLGVEVRDSRNTAPEPIIRYRLSKGVLTAAHVQRAVSFYRMHNRSTQDRTMLVEHPITPEWTYAGTEKPVEKTREQYRFEWTVPAGKTFTGEVLEEHEKAESRRVADLPDATLKSVVTAVETSKPIQDALRTVLDKRARLTATQVELTDLTEQRQVNDKEQARLLAVIDKVPEGSAIRKRYQETLDQFKAATVKLDQQISEKTDALKKQHQDLDDTQKKVTVE